MADTRYLKRRHETWFFALAIPRALRSKFLSKQGKERTHLIVSLKTRDLVVAQQGRWAKLLEAQETFAALAGDTRSVPNTLAPEALLRIDDFARAHYSDVLKKMDAEARNGTAWGKPELERAWQEACDGYLIERNFKPVAEALAAYREYTAVEVDSEHYNLLGDALLSARLRALEGRQRYLEGKPSDEPETFLIYRPIDPMTLKPLRSAGGIGLIFSEVADHFIKEKQRDPAFALTEQTKGQYEAAYRLFDEWATRPRLDEIDRTKASAFLDAISSLSPKWGRGPGIKAMSFDEIVKRFGGHTPGLSAKTVNRYAMALSMVWQHAEDRRGYIGPNPWTRQSRSTAKRRGSSETKKRAFTAAEIAKLLERGPTIEAAIDVPGTLPWLTLISAYSGMRLNEICELDVEDVKESGSILFFDLTEGKTDAGVRCVPVHSKILAAGFRNYLANVKAGALWPGLKPGGPDEKKSWYVSKRFTDYRRDLKLIAIDKVTGRDRLDFHSLRRSAITALKHAEIPEHDVAEVVGHEHPRVTFGVYPDRQRLDRLKAVVEAIRYGF